MFETEETLSPEEILQELAVILARGYLRLRTGLKSPSLPDELGPEQVEEFPENPLDSVAEAIPHDP